MNFTEIPDDIWFSIFEQLDDPPTLAILVRTCRRFHGLASKLLLRELKWIKPDLTLRNIEAWAAIYSSLVALPRKITIGVPFEFTHAMKLPIPHSLVLSAEMKLHDLIHMQLLRFTSISEICLDGTLISPYTYCVLGQIPTLRCLRLENCSFINLLVSFSTRASNPFLPPPFGPHSSQPDPDIVCPLEIISAVPIKHLSIHRVIVPSEYENHRYHPLSLLTIPTLTSLSITWNANIAARYAQNRWVLPSLTDLSVCIPLMSRDLVDELAIFVDRCELSPKFRLKIDKHNLSDSQMTTVHVPSNGLWNYEGPLVIVAGSTTKSLKLTLTHVKINETLELPPLLDGLEKLPASIEELEVQVGKWDIELLFAIKHLFRGIQKLVVRYVRGGLPQNLLVRLGADILFCLPNLVSIKLLGPKPQEGANADRSSANIGSSIIFGAGTSSPPISNLSHIHPHSSLSRASIFHNAFIGGEPWNGSDNELDDEFERLDEGQGEAALGAASSSAVPLRSTPTHTFSSFQSNRPGLLSWNPASMPRRSAPFSSTTPMITSSSLPTFRSSLSSCSRQTGVSVKNQVRSEKQNSIYKPEPSSPLSQTELGDYLIGWSRYCLSLRVVQIDHRWWWERRFVGDQWTLHVYQDIARNKDKGKEREVSLFS